MSRTDFIHLWFIMLSCIWIASCGTASPPASYYFLNTLAEGQGALKIQSRSAVGVGPVTLPGYLDRPQLVTRIGPNQMRIDEYHRWAGDLEQEIPRVITENLIALTGSDRIVAIPWPAGFTPDITVQLEVYSFEGNSDGSARLRATVTLVGQHPNDVPRVWTVDLKEPAEGRDYLALVAAQSRLLVTLSRQIAERIGN